MPILQWCQIGPFTFLFTLAIMNESFSGILLIFFCEDILTQFNHEPPLGPGQAIALHELRAFKTGSMVAAWITTVKSESKAQMLRIIRMVL
jgi:hypothetical protein